MRALLVRLSSIGDVVHALPALGALREAGWDVDWLAEPASRELLEENPALRRRVDVPPAKAFRVSEARRALRALRASRYDAALDMQGLWKSAAWSRLSGAARVVGWAAAFRREPASAWLLGETAPVPAEAVHVIDKNLSLLRVLGIDAVGARRFPLPPAGERTARADRTLESRGLKRFALLIPGGGWANKLWPAERYGELARRLAARGVPSLVSWGPGERPLAEAVARSGGDAAEPCPPTTLLELGELARRAAVVVGADTGPLHLACALGAPVVGIYGPTDPARNGPFSPADEVVRQAPPCAPCHRRSCPRHDGVMATISAESVLAAVERRLGRAGAAA